MTIPAAITLSGIIRVPDPEIATHGNVGDIRINPNSDVHTTSFDIHDGTGWQPLWVTLSRQGEIGDRHHGMLTHPVFSLPSHYLMAALFSAMAGRMVEYEDAMESYVLPRQPLILEKIFKSANEAALRLGLSRQRALARTKG